MDTYYIPLFKRFKGEILIVTIDETLNNTEEGGSKRTYLQFELGPQGQEELRTWKIEVEDGEIKVTNLDSKDVQQSKYKLSYPVSEKERAENEIENPYWVFPYNIYTDQNASLLEDYNKISSDFFVAVKKSSVKVNNEENTYYDFVTNEYDQWQISEEKYVPTPPSKKTKRGDTYTKWSYRLKL